jgi:chemotaxis protein MotB
MKTLTPLILALFLGINGSLQGALAQTEDASSVKVAEAALAFSAGGIQKSTPRDGIVNLITGDNQTTGNRMLLGKLDVFYLKLDNPSDVAVGDLFTVYRRVRKVFHPVTKQYLGFTTIRLAVAKVTEVDHRLTTVQAIRSYGTVAPGDLVMRFSAPASGVEIDHTADVADISGMIVELPADKTMTLVSQADVVYVDRGREDGLKIGALMDIYRHSAGLPSRKIGQLKVLSTEDQTATAKIVKANTRIMNGDRCKLVGFSAPVVQPVELVPAPQPSQAIPAKHEQTVAAPVPTDLVASTLKVKDAAGQSRINLGDLNNLLRYDSGEAAIKPESYKVLDQLIEYLRSSGDERLIRVEGHADNVEIGPSLKSRYPSNWELSKARANGVVRYLVEKGGLDSARLSSVGYGDSRPAATNTIEEGRTKNRRVEILLYAPTQGTPEVANPEISNQAKQSDSDPSSLRARGNDDHTTAPAAATDAKTPVTDPSANVGQDPVPSVDGPGTLSIPDSSKTISPDAGSQDPAQPAPAPVQ